MVLIRNAHRISGFSAKEKYRENRVIFLKVTKLLQITDIFVKYRTETKVLGATLISPDGMRAGRHASVSQEIWGAAWLITVTTTTSLMI